MAKRKADETSIATNGPDDLVRFVGLVRREDRARFKFFCERSGRDMETVAAAWVMERLAEEERKLAKAK